MLISTPQMCVYFLHGGNFKRFVVAFLLCKIVEFMLITFFYVVNIFYVINFLLNYKQRKLIFVQGKKKCGNITYYTHRKIYSKLFTI